MQSNDMNACSKSQQDILVIELMMFTVCRKSIFMILYKHHHHRFVVRFPIGLDFSLITVFLQPDALPDVNHMRGMQYQIVLNIIVLPEIN